MKSRSFLLQYGHERANMLADSRREDFYNRFEESGARRFKRTSRNRSTHTSSRLSIVPTWDVLSADKVLRFLVQAFCLILVALAPWHYGSVGWGTQYKIMVASGVLLVLIAIYLLCCLWRKREIPKVPAISWLFLGLATYSLVQGLEVFPRDYEGSVPSSIAIQKWALGEGVEPFNQRLLLLRSSGSPSTDLPCDAPRSEFERLALSIEPLHTRGAAIALLLCAAFAFVGSAFFTSRREHFALLAAIAIVGGAVACFGFLGAYSYRSENFLGLRTGSSFACFKSKNSAGCFLNTCLAASAGLVVWTQIHFQRKDSDIRYKVADGSILMKVRGAIEDFLSDLTTPQIAAVICAVVIGISVIVSQCRGAVLAAIAATIATAMIAGKKSSRSGSLIAPTLIILAALAASIAFQLDEDSYDRLETLAEFDLEADSASGRLYIWSVALNAIGHFGLLGSGLGTFHYAYLPFQKPTSAGWFYHAESLYLQAGVELGLIGLAVILFSVVRIGSKFQGHVPRDAWKTITPIRVAGTFLFFSQVTHSFVDFGLILPASFLPACLLLGASLASIDSAKFLSLQKKDKRTLQDPTDVIKQSNSRTIVVTLFLVALGLAGIASKSSLENLAETETFGQKFSELCNVPVSAKKAGALNNLLNEWPLSADALKRSPDALRFLTQAAIQDLRLGILASSPSKNWETDWILTDPILLQLRLDREDSPEEQAKILQVAGGNKAIETMKNASEWFALAHTKSPLDWRLCWGRARTTVTCSRENMLPLVTPSVQLGQHSTNQLIECSLLFRNQLSETQINKIWQQAMKTNPSTAISTARIMVEELGLENLDLDAFPQRSDILRSLATQVFSAAKYPEIHRQLWTRARNLLEKSAMPRSTREIWLADAAKALGEEEVEIQHLRVAVSYEPNNFKLAHRFALRLLEIGELDEVKNITNRLKRMDPDAREVKDLESKLKTQRNN